MTQGIGTGFDHQAVHRIVLDPVAKRLSKFLEIDRAEACLGVESDVAVASEDVRAHYVFADRPDQISLCAAPNAVRQTNFLAHGRKYITVAALGCMLSACTQTVADSACQSFQPITFSASQDSAETIRQVREFNAAWDAICGR